MRDAAYPPVAEGLIAWDADGRAELLAGRERATGRIVFPAPRDAERFEPCALPRSGTLWSWTIQRFRPKSPPYAGPEAFEPYAVGYVALGEAIIVEGRLEQVALDALAIGLKMKVAAVPFSMADGSVLLSYAFVPDEAAA